MLIEAEPQLPSSLIVRLFLNGDEWYWYQRRDLHMICSKHGVVLVQGKDRSSCAIVLAEIVRGYDDLS